MGMETVMVRMRSEWTRIKDDEYVSLSYSQAAACKEL